MAIKAATSDFDKTFTGYMVDTDDGPVAEHCPESRAVDIVEGSPKIFLTSKEASQAYADAHYVQSRCGADGREWPQNIRIMETDMHLVALSATCMDIAKMIDKLHEQTDIQDTLASRFFAEASGLGLKGQSLISSVHFFGSGLVKQDLVEQEQDNLNLFDSGEAAAMLQNMKDSTFPRDGNIMTHPLYSSATEMAHDFIMASGLVDRGFMARNPRVIMGALVLSHDAAKPSALPITEENTAPHIRMMREMKKMAL